MSNKVRLSDIDVTVTYRVCLGGLDVTEKVYKGLEKLKKESCFTDAYDSDVLEAKYWLSTHIEEKDSFWGEYKIDNIEREVNND